MAAIPTGIEVVPTGAEIGADIIGVDLMNLNDDAFEIIRIAALDLLVLRFRDQSLTDPGLLSLIHI